MSFRKGNLKPLYKVNQFNWIVLNVMLAPSKNLMVLFNLNEHYQMFYNNPCLEVVLSIKDNFFLFEAFFEEIAFAIAEKNNEEEGKIIP